MARLEGGLFSSPSGHNNGLVFGKGRTRDGKKTTVRELVKPSDPRTNAQLAQRDRFSAALQIVRDIGRAIYQLDWNNSVGSLPGFHSLMSIITDALDMDGQTLSSPDSVTLGIRHFPDSFSASAGTDVIDVTWSTEVGEIGAATDTAKIIAVEVNGSGPDWNRAVILDTSATRDDGSASLPATGVATGDFVVGLYFTADEIGVPSEELRSSAEWVDIT